MAVTFGIIGAGGIANKLHLPQMQAMPGARVKSIAGRKETRLRILADRWQIPHWTHDWHDLLADPEIDAVIVALPHPLHVPAGVAVLEAGKHLLMQKPLCDTMDDAHRFVEAADAAAGLGIVTLAMPHFAPAIYAARDEIARGAIGRVSGASGRSSHGGPEVYYAEVRDAFEETGNDLWFFDAAQASVGALFDMGVYATSQLVAVGGTVARVFGRTSTFDKPTQLEDTATLLLEFESGALGTMETGWCDPARTGFLHVHGTRGKLQAPGHAGNPPHAVDPRVIHSRGRPGDPRGHRRCAARYRQRARTPHCVHRGEGPAPGVQRPVRPSRHRGATRWPRVREVRGPREPPNPCDVAAPRSPLSLFHSRTAT